MSQDRPTASIHDLPTQAGKPTQAPRPILYPSGEKVGDTIGAYKLLQVLGEGGFGTVWLAERTSGIVQRVALKVIKPGMDSRSVIARFEQERQALAMMDHPNIAKVFDAGTTDNGRPYFVMEHVEGKPVSDYCDEAKLNIRQRLELFIPVCEAVQHAHMKGIIHRDLKPSNVLITVKDGVAIPKVIDFGIAKAMSHTLTDKTIFTETGALLGTPEYMSPEQAEIGASDIDTRTDVYSLGVMLYELLTGVLPFDSRELRSKGYAEIQRIIREVDPPAPSKRLTTIARVTTMAAANATTIVGARTIEDIVNTRTDRVETLTRELRQELEWIPIKAMRKHREERYTSPLHLAQDIKRYLERQPLEAGPPTVRYKVGKFVKRRKGLVGAVSVCVLAVVGGLVVALYGLDQANKQLVLTNKAKAEVETQKTAAEKARDLAVVQQKRAEATVQFIRDSVEHANPFIQPTELTLRELVDEMSGQLKAGGNSFDSSTKATVQEMIGATYRALGYPDKALPHLESALASLGSGTTDPMAERLLLVLASAKIDKAKYDEAAPLVDQLAKSTSASPAYVAAALKTKAAIFLGKGDRTQAEKALREAMDYSVKNFGADSTAAGDCIQELSVAIADTAARREEALDLAQKALAIRQKNEGEQSPRLAASWSNVGKILHRLNKLDEAEKALLKAVAIAQAVPHYPKAMLASPQSELALLYRTRDRLDEAQKLGEQALANRKAAGAPDSAIAESLDLLAGLAVDRGQFDAAERLYRDELKLYTGTSTADRARAAQAQTGLADALVRSGRYQEAFEQASLALDTRKQILGDTDWRTMSSQSLVGAALTGLKKFDQAEPLLVAASEAAMANATLPAKKRKQVVDRLIGLYDAWGKADKSLSWKDRLSKQPGDK